MTAFILDSFGTAHTTSTCEEFHGPAIGSVPGGSEFVVCADCEPIEKARRDYSGFAWAICSCATVILIAVWWAESLAVSR